MIISFIANAIEVVRFYFLLQFLQINISLAITGFVFSASAFIEILSMIPGGVGISEFSLSQLIAFFSESSQIKTAVIIDRIISYYLLILIGAAMLMKYSVFKKKSKNES